MSATVAFFYLFGALSVAGALGMVLNFRNTVAAAMSLVVTMVSLGAMYVLLEAHLIAVIQIMVYAGAIVVLFLFVVMLLNLRRDDFPAPRQRLAKGLGAAIALLLLIGFVDRLGPALPALRELPDGFGGYRHVGLALYSDFVLPFEITSLLLLAAIVGAVVLAKRRLD